MIWITFGVTWSDSGSLMVQAPCSSLAVATASWSSCKGTLYGILQLLHCTHRFRHEKQDVDTIFQYSDFPIIKIMVILQVRMSPASIADRAWGSKLVKSHSAHKSHGHILFAFVSTCVVSKDRINPNWRSMADDAFTQGSIGLVSLALIYDCMVAPVGY